MSEITVKRSGAKRRSQMSRAQAKAAWGLSAPAIIIMFLFMILPFFMSAFYSFTDRRLVLNPNKPTKFVGWANYIKTFTNKTALQAFWNTFEYTIILVPVVLILATLLALLDRHLGLLLLQHGGRSVQLDPARVRRSGAEVASAYDAGDAVHRDHVHLAVRRHADDYHARRPPVHPGGAV